MLYKHPVLFLAIIFLTANITVAEKRQANSKAVNPPAKTTADTAGIKQASKVNDKLTVYYFRNNRRCPSCFRIETFSKTAVEEGFPSEVKDGRMEWKMVNVQDPGNEFYVDKYQIYTKMVILSSTKDGKELKWKNLDRVWDLLGDEDVFKGYIQQGIRDFLAGK